jgi:flagellar hook-associated protein FlgK
MIPSLNVAVSGLLAASKRVLAGATNIANAQTENYQPIKTNVVSEQAGPNNGAGVLATNVPRLPVTEVNIESEAVDIIAASAAYKANAAVIRAVDRNEDALLRALDTRA